MTKEQVQIHRHAGYRFIKLGREIESIGEQLIEEDKDENRARSLVADALAETSKVAKAASKTRANYHIVSAVVSIIAAILLVDCIPTVTVPIVAAAYGACLSCAIIVAITNLSLLRNDT